MEKTPEKLQVQASTMQAGLTRIDSVFRMRSLGVAATGIPDQYADGKAAKVWNVYIGGQEQRTAQYRDWFVEQLRDHRCKTVLDVACGTGVDSIMLLDNGFSVVSTDASDKMLKYALKERWRRRKEEPFDEWVIEEANWLTLVDDLESEGIATQFDAVVCLGNSFAHLPDFEGDQSAHVLALSNFAAMVKPGGVLVIDHRNYDAILEKSAVPQRNVYYNSDQVHDIKVSNLYVNGRPTLVTLDYYMTNREKTAEKSDSEAMPPKKPNLHHFRLSYFPHRVNDFTNMLNVAFNGKCEHSLYGDFKPYKPEDTPAYFIHVVKKIS